MNLTKTEMKNFWNEGIAAQEFICVKGPNTFLKVQPGKTEPAIII